MKTKPFYLVVDSMDGGGKGTLGRKFLLDFPMAKTVREPGGTPVGELVRASMASANGLTPSDIFHRMLFQRSLLRREISNYDGRLVFSDRGDSTTYAYQIFGQQSPELEPLFWDYFESMPPNPDAYVFLELEPEESVRRTQNNDREHADATLREFDKDIALQARVRDGFRSFAAELKKRGYLTPCIFVDSSGTPEQTYETALSGLLEIPTIRELWTMK
jgi:thymidylate kinase